MGFQSADTESYSAALHDPGIERRVRRIVQDALSQYEWVMEFGSASERLQLMKSSLPNLIRELRNRDERARNDEMSKAYQELRLAFRAHVKERSIEEVLAAELEGGGTS